MKRCPSFWGQSVDESDSLFDFRCPPCNMLTGSTSVAYDAFVGCTLDVGLPTQDMEFWLEHNNSGWGESPNIRSWGGGA